MSFTQAMQAGQPQPGGPPGQQQPHPVQQLAQAAATACGQLVQALHSVPGIDTAALDTAAAQLRQSLMAVVQSAKPRGQMASGAPPPGAPPG